MRKFSVYKNTALFTLLGILVAFAIFGTKKLKQVGFVPIEVVTLSNKLQYADPVLIKEAVRKHLAAGFFGLKVNAIREDLKTVPWIANATVQRLWPNTVRLKILERQPLAVWRSLGVVDTEGKLFFPASLAALEDLPEFDGSEEQIDAMVDIYLLILAKLKPIGLAVKRLEIMPDQGWRAMLDNGVTIVLGQNELEERLARFVLAYGKISDQKIKVIDLRYTNGLAVG